MATVSTGERRRLAAFAALSICAFCAPLAAQTSSQTITAAGLSAPGTIYYDALGMPTLKAATSRLAELVGKAALASDVQTRTLGLDRAAFATWQALDPDTKGWLKSFSDGVNFWLATQPLPPEYGDRKSTRLNSSHH